MTTPAFSARKVIAGTVILAGVVVGFSAALAGVRGNSDVAASLPAIGLPPLPPGTTAPAAVVPDPSVQNGRIRVHLPGEWTLDSSTSEELALAGPHVLVRLGDRTVDALDSDLNDSRLAADALTADQKRYPDARLCHDPIPEAVNNGPNGRAFAICYTATPQDGRSTAADALVVEALVTAGDGTRHLLSERAVLADADSQAAAAELPSVLTTIEWRTVTG